MSQSQWLERYQSALMRNFGVPKRVFVKGEGIHLWDADGKRFTDMFSGIAVGGLGHGHPAVAEAVASQMRTLGHISNLYASPPQIALAERLVSLTGEPSRVYFANSGTEANEAALKVTRLTGRTKIVAMTGSFHGRTMGALALTSTNKYRTPFEPLPGEVVFSPFNDVDALASVVDDTTAAVILETVQGESGVIPANSEFLIAAREITSVHGALLWVDEVQTGIGRCGEWLTSVADGLGADLITVAKGLGNGIPMGACLATGPAGELFTPGSHGSTFAGNPIAAAAGLAVLDTIATEGLLDNAHAMGRLIKESLLGLGNPGIREVRGRGLLLGVGLSDQTGSRIVDAMLDAGWIIQAPRPDVLRLAPPLIVDAKTVAEFVEVLDDMVKRVRNNDR